MRTPEPQIKEALYQVHALLCSCAPVMRCTWIPWSRPRSKWFWLPLVQKQGPEAEKIGTLRCGGALSPTPRPPRAEAGNALQVTLISEVLRIIRSLVAGRTDQIVAGIAIRVREAPGAILAVRVTERGLEIVGPTAKVFQVNAGKMRVPVFPLSNISWMFVAFI